MLWNWRRLILNGLVLHFEVLTSSANIDQKSSYVNSSSCGSCLHFEVLTSSANIDQKSSYVNSSSCGSC